MKNMTLVTFDSLLHKTKISDSFIAEVGNTFELKEAIKKFFADKGQKVEVTLKQSSGKENGTDIFSVIEGDKRLVATCYKLPVVGYTA